MGFLKLIVQVFFMCFELTCGWERWGFQGWGPEGWGPEGWGPKPRKSGAPKGGAPKGGGPNPEKVLGRVEPRRAGGPKFRAFFSLSHRKIRSFLSSLGVFSWNFGGV